MFAFVGCYYNRRIFGASLNLLKKRQNFNKVKLVGGLVCVSESVRVSVTYFLLERDETEPVF
jgi:hypothetical protein